MLWNSAYKGQDRKAESHSLWIPWINDARSKDGLDQNIYKSHNRPEL